MPVNYGALQGYALTINKFIDHAARWHPAAEVVTRGPEGAVRRSSYAEVRSRAARLSTALTGLAVRGGDAVATLAWNTQAHLEAWYAIMGMGAVCHTLNPRLSSAALADMLAQSEARILIASADLAAEVKAILDELPAPLLVLAIDGPAGAFVRLGIPAETLDGIVDAAPVEAVWGAFGEDAPCGLCFTSGTTGPPKGVTYTHRGNYLHTLRQLQADVAGLTARDTVMPVVPMFHANAWGLPFAAPAAGARLVLPGREAQGRALAELIEREGVTVAAGVPTVWLGMFDHLDAAQHSLPSLRRIMVGGAAMPEALMRRIEARGIEVQTTWGMTELSPLGTATPPSEPFRDPAVSGRPALGLDLRLTDAGGEPLASQRDGAGHLWARGHSVVERYLGDAESATSDGWFPTGDLARIDESGMLTITGRSKDLIKSGGEWINPAQIEAIVARHPDVAKAAVIGRHDRKWGERPILLVELNPAASIGDEELLAPLRQEVAPWWIPDAVLRLDIMPLAATGKVDKLYLRHQYAGM